MLLMKIFRKNSNFKSSFESLNLLFYLSQRKQHFVICGKNNQCPVCVASLREKKKSFLLCILDVCFAIIVVWWNHSSWYLTGDDDIIATCSCRWRWWFLHKCVRLLLLIRQWQCDRRLSCLRWLEFYLTRQFREHWSVLRSGTHQQVSGWIQTAQHLNSNAYKKIK